MNSNDDNHSGASGAPGEGLLERYLAAATLPEVDTRGVAALTRIKIERDRLARSRRRWRLLTAAASAAAAVALLMVAGAPWGGGATPADPAAAPAAEAPSYCELTVPTGQRTTLMLADGTRLIANSRSHVRYPTRFDGGMRHVWAAGEVYFEVAKDAARPFVVSGDGFSVKVLGTKFCLTNYHPDRASVVLVEGSVAVTTDADERLRLRPSQRVSIASGAIDEVAYVDTSLYTSWIYGGMLLENQTLASVASRLSTYYGVAIEVDPALAGRRLYGRLDLKSDIDGVLAVLRSILPISVEALPEGTTYRIAPGHTNNP